MALEGSLTDFGLADILQLIYFQRKTGILTLEGKLDKVKLLFIDGNVVGAESKRRIDDSRLGKILLKRGLIGEGDLQIALEEQNKTKAKLGAILIRKEFVGNDVIGDIINGQITETVIQIFSWKQGTYEFTSQSISQDKVLSMSLDTQHLLMEGLRIVDEWSLIRGKITLDTVFRKRGEGAADLNEEEIEILKYVDGENDVGTIIELSGGDNFQISKTLLSLMERGAVEEAESVPLVSVAEADAAKRRKLLLPIRLLVSAVFFVSLILSLSVTAFNKAGLSREFRAGGKLETLSFQIEAYKFEHSFYPPVLDIISTERDPWGHPYIYRVTGDSFFLASAGADGKEGTGDDIY
jgi:hypothetical protein